MRMKKISSIICAAVLAVSMFAGCAGGNTPSETSASDKAQVNSFKCEWKGVDITPGKDCKAAIEALGDGYKYFSGADCAYEGMNSVYDYTDVTLYAYTEKDGADELISIVEVKGADLKTSEGVGNGDSPDKIKEVYGDPAVENKGGLLYKSDKMELSFFVKDGKVTSMTYSLIRGE